MDEFKRKRVEVDFPFDDYRFLVRVAFDLGISVPQLLREMVQIEKDSFLSLHKDFVY